MIVYDNLGELLKKRNLKYIDLQREMELSPSLTAKLSKNRTVSTDTINRVCEYLQVQPGDIMSWVPDSEYEEKEKQKADIEAQIAQLQAQLKKL